MDHKELMGAPGPLQFGRHNSVTLSEWKVNLQSILQIYSIPDAHQMDLVLNSLEGEAKREILILPS